MQMCPFCNSVYDESEYGYCPYCSSELKPNITEKPYKICPNCQGIMYWDDCWQCENCGNEIYSEENDNDGIIDG